MSGADSPSNERIWPDSRGREQFRAELLTRIPSWYVPRAHLAATVGIGLAALSLAVWRLDNVSAIELLVVPMTFVGANLYEWWAHRDVLHRRFEPWTVLYRRHTPIHHRIYRYGDMAIRSPNELRLVLIPAAGVFGLIVLASPVATLLGWLISANVGWLYLLTASVYVVSYEVTHLCYHLPRTHWAYRLPFMEALAEHHARHHHPPLMQRWNFNVTLPLGDWLFGTLAPPELVERASRQVRGRSDAEHAESAESSSL